MDSVSPILIPKGSSFADRSTERKRLGECLRIPSFEFLLMSYEHFLYFRGGFASTGPTDDITRYSLVSLLIKDRNSSGGTTRSIGGDLGRYR